MAGRQTCVPIVALSILSSTIVRAAQPLQALGAWDLDYGETHCIAMRSYGKSDDPINFGIIPAPNGDTYELLVARKHAGPVFAEELKGSVDFGTRPIKAWLLHYASKDGKIDAYRYRISAAEMSQATNANSIRLHAEDGTDQAFALDAMPALLKGLRECHGRSAKLLEHGR